MMQLGENTEDEAIGCFPDLKTGIIKLPMWGGSKFRQMYGTFEGFPINSAIFWVGNIFGTPILEESNTLPETNSLKWMVGIRSFPFHIMKLPSRSLTKIAPEKLPFHPIGRASPSSNHPTIFLSGPQLAVKLRGCTYLGGIKVPKKMYGKFEGLPPKIVQFFWVGTIMNPLKVVFLDSFGGNRLVTLLQCLT